MVETSFLRHQNLLEIIYDQFVISNYSVIIDVSIPSYFINEFQSIDYNLIEEVSGDVIHVGGDGIPRFHNSIIGQYIFENIIDDEVIIGAVVRFANFVGSHPSEGKYRWIVRRFHRYWNLKRLLGSATLPLEVFDRSSHIPTIASDPLFWVQYSIAQMENGNFLPAWRYIDNAYSKADAKNKDFDNHHIDTHWARLAVREIGDLGWNEKSSEKILRAVEKLHMVLIRRGSDSVYHISSVILDVLNLQSSFSYEMGPRQFSSFSNSLKSIYHLIEKLSSSDAILEDEKIAAQQLRDFLKSVNKL